MTTRNNANTDEPILTFRFSDIGNSVLYISRSTCFPLRIYEVDEDGHSQLNVTTATDDFRFVYDNQANRNADYVEFNNAISLLLGGDVK